MLFHGGKHDSTLKKARDTMIQLAMKETHLLRKRRKKERKTKQGNNYNNTNNSLVDCFHVGIVCESYKERGVWEDGTEFLYRE